MKYIFIAYPLDIVDTDVFSYTIGQNFKSLILTKNYMHHILGRKE
jgi:hypothetical protein